MTAGNSCADADGAAAVLIATAQVARDLGATTALAFRGASTQGVDPTRLGLGAAAAAARLLAEQGVAARQLAAVEFNEAFAGQVLACTDLLGIDEQILNADGGALALGHAYGASGAVSVVRLLARARDLPEGSLLLAMISSAGGIGTAALFDDDVVAPAWRPRAGALPAPGERAPAPDPALALRTVTDGGRANKGIF